MVFTVISITASNGDGLFYVKKGTKVTGLKNVHIASFTKKTKQNVFYVKEKTVFHAEKNTNIKVVFVSNTKEVAKDEKVISTINKPTLQLKKRKQAQLELKPNHKLPFTIGYFNFYGNNLAVLLFNNSQNAKVNTFLSDKTNHAVSISIDTVCHAISISNNYHYKTSKYTTSILNLNFGRPPPVA